jgi:hypothetical protein
MKKYLFNILISVFVFTTFSCHDTSTNPNTPNDETSIGKAASYYALKTGNRWSYTFSAMASNPIASQFTPYCYKIITGDTVRHQDGTLLYYISDQVSARVPYTVVFLYAPTDSGVICYYGLYDSVLTNSQWIKTNFLKTRLLMDPIVVGHSWSAKTSDSTETYQIVSINPEVVGTISRSVIGIVHNTSSDIDTSWYAKNYGLIRIHTYSKGTNPLQGYISCLDSCRVQ